MTDPLLDGRRISLRVSPNRTVPRGAGLAHGVAFNLGFQELDQFAAIRRLAKTGRRARFSRILDIAGAETARLNENGQMSESLFITHAFQNFVRTLILRTHIEQQHVGQRKIDAIGIDPFAAEISHGGQAFAGDMEIERKIGGKQRLADKDYISRSVFDIKECFIHRTELPPDKTEPTIPRQHAQNDRPGVIKPAMLFELPDVRLMATDRYSAVHKSFIPTICCASASQTFNLKQRTIS